jgi:hypothetical protein
MLSNVPGAFSQGYWFESNRGSKAPAQRPVRLLRGDDSSRGRITNDDWPKCGLLRVGQSHLPDSRATALGSVEDRAARRRCRVVLETASSMKARVWETGEFAERTSRVMR